MAYEKQNFADGEVLYAEQLNRIEAKLKEMDEEMVRSVNGFPADTEGNVDIDLPPTPPMTGEPGFSPSVTIMQTETGAEISVTDQNGTTTATVSNGEQGPQGIQGKTGERGPQGIQGNPGRGIVSIRRTAGSGLPGTYDFYTITYTDGGTDRITVYNGADGSGIVMDVTEKTTETVQFEEQTVDMSASTLVTLNAPNLTLVEGEEYIVRFNGTDYAGKALRGAGESSEYLYLGNGGLVEWLGVESNGAPFCIYKGETSASVFLQVNDNQSSAITLEIVYVTTEIVEKIPAKYLPDDLSVEVSGGGVNVTGATPGQLIIVKSVDENGKPTEWEAVDRTHWAEGGMVENLPETQMPWDEDLGFYSMDARLSSITAGMKCIVTWNGVEYIDTAKSFTMDGLTVITLGDFNAYMGDEPTGEYPFAAMILPAELASQMGGITATFVPVLEITDSLTLSVSSRHETVHKLDNKYLNLDWLPTKTNEDIEIVPETAITDDWHQLEGVDASQLVVGEKYTITFDGVSFSGIAENYSALSGAMYGVIVGNKSVLNVWNAGYEDTGEPGALFSITSAEEKQVAYACVDSSVTSGTVQVVRHANLYNKMPTEYLPDGFGDAPQIFNLEEAGIIPFGEWGTLNVDSDTITQMITALNEKRKIELWVIFEHKNNTRAVKAVFNAVHNYVWIYQMSFNWLENNNLYCVTLKISTDASDTYGVTGICVMLNDSAVTPEITSPNGTKYKVVVADDGTLSTEAVTT